VRETRVVDADTGDRDRSRVTNAEEADPTDLVHVSDPVLIQACLAGDEGAWEELVDRYGRLVYAIPKRMGLTDSDAQDVFQDVFLTLLRRLADLRDHTRLSAWLITTTRREAWRYGRARARRAESALEEAIDDEAPSPIDDVVRWEREQAVRQAMRRLDARCRELLTMLFLEPAATRYEVIATRLGMPVGSIGPTRARCFKKLDAILRDMGIDDGA
jgi:RNA polymerase sigma factor (sigma-70 family)